MANVNTVHNIVELKTIIRHVGQKLVINTRSLMFSVSAPNVRQGLGQILKIEIVYILMEKLCALLLNTGLNQDIAVLVPILQFTTQ